jgi:tetratricopeptide (TPR) repeat protein
MRQFAPKRRRAEIARFLLTLFGLLFFSERRLVAQFSPEVSRVFTQASEAMRRGDLNVAADGFFAAAKLAPSFAEAHFNLGLVREEQGRLDDAIASLEKALTLKPRLHGANLFLAVAHYKLNHYDEALAAVRKETELYPHDASPWMWLGVIELAKDQPEKAAAALDKAVSLDPNNVDILYHRGQAHLLVSRSSYERMFKEDPKSWRVHEVLGQISTDAERYNDAIYEYLEAIKLAPTQPGLHEELGATYRRAIKMDEADAAFQAELEINPHNALARYERGVLAMEKGDGAKAKELIEAALSEKGGLMHADYNLGRAEKLLGDDAAAVADLERAIANDPDPEIVEQCWYQLGTLYRRLHRPEDAQKAMASFEKLTGEEADKSQNALRKYHERQNPNSSDAVPTAEKPRY